MCYTTTYQIIFSSCLLALLKGGQTFGSGKVRESRDCA